MECHLQGLFMRLTTLSNGSINLCGYRHSEIMITYLLIHRVHIKEGASNLFVVTFTNINGFFIHRRAQLRKKMRKCLK